MSYANANQINYVAMIGENERKANKITLRNMSTGEQDLLTLEELIQKLK